MAKKIAREHYLSINYFNTENRGGRFYKIKP